MLLLLFHHRILYFQELVWKYAILIPSSPHICRSFPNLSSLFRLEGCKAQRISYSQHEFRYCLLPWPYDAGWKRSHDHSYFGSLLLTYFICDQIFNLSLAPQTQSWSYLRSQFDDAGNIILYFTPSCHLLLNADTLHIPVNRSDRISRSIDKTMWGMQRIRKANQWNSTKDTPGTKQRKKQPFDSLRAQDLLPTVQLTLAPSSNFFHLFRLKKVQPGHSYCLVSMPWLKKWWDYINEPNRERCVQ